MSNSDLEFPYRDVLIIANPIAGRGRAEKAARELHSRLSAAGVACSLGLTRQRGDGAQLVHNRRAGTDLVIAVGGDGTLGDVLAGLPAELPIAVLSMGTANVMAHDLHLPQTPASLLAMLARGKTTQLDVADVDGRLSFLVTGVGIDGAIVQRIEATRRGPIRKLSYLSATLATLWRWRPPRLRVQIDGHPVHGEWAWVLVSNIIGYGGFLRLAPDRKLDDGLLEVFLFPRGSRLALLAYGLRGALRHLPGGDCRMLRAKEVEIQSDHPAPYQVDGDFGGITPVKVAWKGRRHRLCVPS